MQKTITLSLLFILFVGSKAYSQSTDSGKTVANAWYARITPLSVYAGAGLLADRVAQDIEVGKSFGVMDVGLALGRSSQRSDSTTYLQGRFTMDASQYGIFSNEIAIGAGYNFNSTTPLMLELSSTIMAQVSKHLGIGIIAGFYDFSGSTVDSSKNFYGLFLRYGLQRSESGALMGAGHKSHAHHGK